MSKWPRVPLGEVLTKSTEQVEILPRETYREVTVRLWGKGVDLRREATGTEIKADKRFTVTPGQFIVSRIDARNGAFGLIPEVLDGAIVSNDFPVFDTNCKRLAPAFLNWLSKTSAFVDLCRKASEGTTNRVRLKEHIFLQMEIPLPPLCEQQRIVEWIDAVATRVEEADSEAESMVSMLDHLLMSAFREIAEGVPQRPLDEIAPLTRRPAAIDPAAEYPGISARSFGRGTFHNPPLLGSEITWEKPHEVKTGDILVSNIKAWEGAIAVIRQEDDGRFGSHRYLTFAPKEGVATPRYVCFYLLSPEGLFHVGEASPGSADRNRTTGSKAMQRIPVPVPPYERQLWFDELYENVEQAKQSISLARQEREALLPALLAQYFQTQQ